MNRKFDDLFKITAVELSVVKSSVAIVAKELEIDPSLLNKWCRDPRYNGGNKALPDTPKIIQKNKSSGFCVSVSKMRS